MYKKAVFAAVISAAVVLSACGTVQAPVTKQEPNPDKTAVAYGENDYLNLSEPTNVLGEQLISKVKPDSDGNIFVSPVSFLMALSMLQNGADGETRDEILEAIHLKGIDAETINRANASLLKYLQRLKGEVTFKTANSLWLNETYTLEDDFKSVTRDYYSADTEEIDISDSKSVDRINEWVNSSTDGKIEEMVKGPLDSDLVMYLMNAVYFKGSWTYPFNEEMTEDGTFHLEGGSETTVPFMTLYESLPYFENEQFQAVSLPYGDDGKVTMDIFVPKEGHSTESFLKSWTTENRSKWNGSFKSVPGTIRMPKFQLDYDVDLVDLLKKLGMQKAFESREADLSLLVKEEKEKLFVSDVKQKTYLSIDEIGTEAAGVTSISVSIESAPSGEPFQMVADKPFFIAIRDTEADVLLFVGKIANPAQRD